MIEVERHGDLVIYYDPDPDSPRSWDNLGTMQIYSRKYNSPDPIVRDPPYIDPETEVGLKIWAYDHSGVFYKTGEENPFTCPWDSGFAGIIFCTRSRARAWGLHTDDQIRAALAGEVDTYNKFINGWVYGWVAGEDSCWGYYDKQEAINDGLAFQLGTTCPSS